jgi:hypothetical protein
MLNIYFLVVFWYWVLGKLSKKVKINEEVSIHERVCLNDLGTRPARILSLIENRGLVYSLWRPIKCLLYFRGQKTSKGCKRKYPIVPVGS